MKETSRIGVLLFLYTRDELSPAEKEELESWRKQDPENEKLFFQMTDPDSLRAEMQEYYASRDRDFEKLKAQLPGLSASRLSGSVEGDSDLFRDKGPEEEISSGDFEKEYADSGLSPADYWNSRLSVLDDDEQIDKEINSDNKPVRDTYAPKKPVIRRGRTLRRFLRVAAVLAVIVVVDELAFGDKYANYKAEMISTEGVRSDFNRGFAAGAAGIKFGETAKGEPVYIAANDRKKSKDKFYTLITAPGGEFILQLPDSSMIWMNAASSIKYPANFDQDTIRIEVEGEAYMERSKDNTRHYLIGRINTAPDRQSPAIQIQPSSKININTYPGNGDMLVTLIQGEAGLQKSTEKNIPLSVGEQLLTLNDSLASNRTVNTDEAVAWKNGEFYYKDANLQTMMPALVNWYDIKFEYIPPVPDLKFNLRIPRSSPVSDVLDSLKKQGLRFTKQGKTITIWKQLQ